MVLGIQRNYEIELRLQEVDVFLQCASRHLRLQVAVEYLAHGLADVEGIEHLHVRHAIQKDNSDGKSVRMLHFLHQFFTPLLRECLVAPIVEKTVQSVLVDCRQLVRRPVIAAVPAALAGTVSHIASGWTLARWHPSGL